MAVTTINLLLIAICILLALPSLIVTTIVYVMDQHEPPPPAHEPGSNGTCYQDLEFGVANVRKLRMKVTTVMGSMGIIGNLLTLIVLRRCEQTTFNQLLLSLCVIDLTFVLGKVFFDVLMFCTYYKEGLQQFADLDSRIRGLYYFFLMPIYKISFTASIWAVVAASVERYLGICRPFQNRPGIWLYLVLVLGLSVALNISDILAYNLDLTPRAIAYGAMYSQFETYWVQVMVLEFFPLAAMIILNGRIYATLKVSERFQRSADATNGSHNNSARLLFGVVLVFLICNTFRMTSFVLLSEATRQEWSHQYCKEHNLLPYPVAVYVFRDLRNFFITLNSSINFVIYCLVGRKFREQFLSLFKCASIQQNALYTTTNSIRVL